MITRIYTNRALARRSVQLCSLKQPPQWKRPMASKIPETLIARTSCNVSNTPTTKAIKKENFSTTATATPTIASLSSTANNKPYVAEPTRQQLQAHFWTCAVPMLGFGFMDNTVMIYAGNYIDCTIGVWFGLSTLAAAACGQIVANSTSLVFGDTVEKFAVKLGLPNSNLTTKQRGLKIVNRVGLYGSLVGVIVGAILGLGNLLIVDTKQSEMLKLQALSKDQEFLFEIECSNTDRPDATTVTVRGPDVDGLLASMTNALSAYGCSIVELHASPRDHSPIAHINTNSSTNTSEIFEDVFIVRPRGGGNNTQQIDNEDLDEFGKQLLAACKDPLSAHSFKEQVRELEETNSQLMDRISTLEKVVEDRQVTVKPSTNTIGIQTEVPTTAAAKTVIRNGKPGQRTSLQVNMH